LTLDTFEGTSELLTEMASILAKGKANLKTLSITILERQTDDAFVNSLDLFISSFHGLQALTGNCFDCDKIYADGIVNHGETLQSLDIVNGGIHREDPYSCFSAIDMHRMAAACTNLQYFTNLARLVSHQPAQLSGVVDPCRRPANMVS
jgi:hypothetical protein